jgi:integrase
MASIDKRGKVWRARVRIKGFKPKTRSFDSKPEAQEWAARTELQLLAGADTPPDLASEMTLREALEKYANEVTPHKKGAPQELRRIKAWKKRTVATLKLSLLTPAHFNEFKQEREEDDVSDNTIRLDLMVISALFKKAKKEWGMPYVKNPIAGVALPSTSKWRDRRLNDAENARFDRELSKHPKWLFQAIVRFAVQTAARRGEILALHRNDVHLKHRIAVFRDTKNGDNRAVPLTKDAVAILEHVLKQHKEDLVFPMSTAVLYACPVEGRWRIPVFQFANKGLVPNIGVVNAVLPRTLDAVSVLRWYTSPDPELETPGGDVLTPLHWLRASMDPQPVVKIARDL